MQDRFVSLTQRKPKFLFLLVFFVVFAFTIIVLLHYLNTGVLIIKTNSASNKISLVSASKKNNPIIAYGSLKARLSPGSYVVQVNSRLATSSRLVSVAARKSETYTLNLQPPTSPQYVLSQNVSSVVADSQTMYYVGLDDHILYRLNRSGLPSAITSIWFDHIVWQNTSYGVGIGIGGKILYAVQNGAVRQLQLPFSSASPIFDVAPSGMLALSDGHNLYIKQLSGNQYTKVFSSNSGEQITSLKASSNEVLVGISTNDQSSDSDNLKYYAVSTTGQVIASANFSAYSLAWSPDGTKLAVTSDSSTTIYSSTLTPISHLADINVAGLSWYDSNTLLYAANNILTEYSVNTGDSAQLSINSQGNQISGIYPMSQVSTIYFLSDSTSGISQLQGINLSSKASESPGYYYTLGIYFPNTSGLCSFGYTNFLHPVIVVNGWSNQSDCLATVEQQLSNYDLPTNLPVVFEPSGSL